MGCLEFGSFVDGCEFYCLFTALCVTHCSETGDGVTGGAGRVSSGHRAAVVRGAGEADGRRPLER